ncbi:MAG: hypothetical protein QNJ98_12535 [Planctomycetota bacterium]|nr:hypothetical protein [Planctomycetota bacterium]
MNRIPLLVIALACAGFALLPATQTVEAGDSAADASRWDGKRLVAHEWGTFTSVSGSDGVVLDGLMHEETDLPDFVYDLRDRRGITGISPKMETPVIYFYAPSKRKVSVDVRFPRGTVTQWYPAAHRVNHQGRTVNGVPSMPDGRVIEEHKDGYIRWGRWGDLTVLAPDADVTFPAVADDDPWRFCRQTKANALQVCTLNAELGTQTKRELTYEHERCLFYRGLGDFQLPLEGKVQSERVGPRGHAVSVRLRNTNPKESLTHVFLVSVQGERCGFKYVPSLREHKELNITLRLRPKAEATERLVAELAKRLTQTGLFADEALAMARTWQQGYFQDEGLRVLYVLSPAFVDRELPLKIRSIREHKGDAWQVVRTFVGRTELLSPQREMELTKVVETLASKDAPGKVIAEEALARYGRFAVPYLTRAAALANGASAKARIAKALEALTLSR